MKELPDADTGYNTRYLVPREYLKGYIDIDEKRFVESPHFDPQEPSGESPFPLTAPMPRRQSSQTNIQPQEIKLPNNEVASEDSEVW